MDSPHNAGPATKRLKLDVSSHAEGDHVLTVEREPESTASACSALPARRTSGASAVALDADDQPEQPKLVEVAVRCPPVPDGPVPTAESERPTTSKRHHTCCSTAESTSSGEPEAIKSGATALSANGVGSSGGGGAGAESAVSGEVEYVERTVVLDIKNRTNQNAVETQRKFPQRHARRATRKLKLDNGDWVQVKLDHRELHLEGKPCRLLVWTKALSRRGRPQVHGREQQSTRDRWFRYEQRARSARASTYMRQLALEYACKHLKRDLPDSFRLLEGSKSRMSEGYVKETNVQKKLMNVFLEGKDENFLAVYSGRVSALEEGARESDVCFVSTPKPPSPQPPSPPPRVHSLVATNSHGDVKQQQQQGSLGLSKPVQDVFSFMEQQQQQQQHAPEVPRAPLSMREILGGGLQGRTTTTPPLPLPFGLQWPRQLPGYYAGVGAAGLASTVAPSPYDYHLQQQLLLQQQQQQQQQPYTSMGQGQYDAKGPLTYIAATAAAAAVPGLISTVPVGHNLSMPGAAPWTLGASHLPIVGVSTVQQLRAQQQQHPYGQQQAFPSSLSAPSRMLAMSAASSSQSAPALLPEASTRR